MPLPNNFDLLPYEQAILRDTEFLLTKQLVLQKAVLLMGQVAAQLQETGYPATFLFPDGCDFRKGKISRGEHYEGLPYVVLDLPRLFNRQHIFVFRTMLLWGNSFVFTLHVSGQYAQQYAPSIVQNWQQLQQMGLHVNTTNNQWQHLLNRNYYQAIEQTAPDAFLKTAKNNGFFKLCCAMPLAQWSNLPDAAAKTCRILLKAL
ncbi:MAG: hypothetical protein IPI59_03475 [Sphingobacteriales bacterium]|jgi:hypothetical protein|nr:hypothetical protein [Sphingobacteriales bacterium]MBP9141662.1 hypothetical protein [Chitinophagales bacterium]MDA0197485.1 hypothetical protein [Bacteroidota bacterium]MBK6890328.1 hypothetical protein [Sphingobacteriales bacterium]MBK7526619.1 hypothetical protein [Sphingobacteriales bacterium]